MKMSARSLFALVVAAGVVSPLVLIGCTKTERTLAGAGIGAGTGALIGGLAGGPVGAGVGAAAGGVVGGVVGHETYKNKD